MILTLTLASPVLADCNSDYAKLKQDCTAALDAADRTIKARDDLIQTEKAALDKSYKDNLNLRDELQKAEDSRMAWYHNPAILIPVGIIGGLVLGSYLKK